MGVSPLLNALSLILNLLPAIIQAVHSVERAIPGKGQGESKLGVVLNSVEAAATSIKAGVDQVNAVRPAIKQVVDNVVATFNTIGWPTYGE